MGRASRSSRPTAAPISATHSMSRCPKLGSSPFSHPSKSLLESDVKSPPRLNGPYRTSTPPALRTCPSPAKRPFVALRAMCLCFMPTVRFLLPKPSHALSRRAVHHGARLGPPRELVVCGRPGEACSAEGVQQPPTNPTHTGLLLGCRATWQPLLPASPTTQPSNAPVYDQPLCGLGRSSAPSLMTKMADLGVSLAALRAAPRGRRAIIVLRG